MRTFYVNAFYDDSIEKTEYGIYTIGLFGKHGFEGYGNFCGWYSIECYTNTEMYAHYVADCRETLFMPQNRVSEVTVHDPAIKYDEIQIGSCYWDRYIEAETVEEAIEKFKNADWRR